MFFGGPLRRCSSWIWIDLLCLEWVVHARTSTPIFVTWCSSIRVAILPWWIWGIYPSPTSGWWWHPSPTVRVSFSFLWTFYCPPPHSTPWLVFASPPTPSVVSCHSPPSASSWRRSSSSNRDVDNEGPPQSSSTGTSVSFHEHPRFVWFRCRFDA